MEKFFRLEKNGTTVRTEIIAGITTFTTMAYILAVNPSVLSTTGMDANAVLIATAVASAIGCIMMALFSNLPFAMAPGLGLNAFFTYTVCGVMGYTWQFALFAVFIEGIIFIFLSVTNVREAIFNAIPTPLKKGITVGIGLFIAFIGLQNAKLVVDGPTLVTIVDFSENFHSVGIGAILSLVGLFLIIILRMKNVPGFVLFGILLTWIIGIACQLTGIYVPVPEEGFNSLIPSLSSFNLTSVGHTFGECFNFDAMGSVEIIDFVFITCSFLCIDLFDTIGALIGIGSKANMLDENGKLPHIKGALIADSIATAAGALVGTSTITTYVESSAGVAEGGRTGLTSITVGVLFLASIIFAPIFTAIPSFATAPALIYVGFLMISAVADINFNDLCEAIPAYLTLLAVPLTYSISEGISLGVISYVVMHVATGKAKQVNIIVYIIAILFILKYIYL